MYSYSQETFDRPGAADYVLGRGSAEQQRLQEQGTNLYWLTRRLLQAAGLAPGMRVLDVGCGTGDVTLIAAELVGPSGSVLGIDCSVDVLATARSRLAAHGERHVHFRKDDAASYHEVEPFDAVVVAWCSSTRQIADRSHAQWLADTVRTLLPRIEHLGITTRDEVDISTLTDRLCAEAAESEGTACGMALVCAWARAPRE